MIVGSLKNTERIEQAHPLLKKAFDYIKANDLLAADLGTIHLEDDLFINNVELQGKEAEDSALEAHKVWSDIHVVLEGEESIGWKALEDAQDISVPYNEDKDVMFFSDAADSYANLKPGQFAVVFPEDVHAPNISTGVIRKLVVKLKV